MRHADPPRSVLIAGISGSGKSAIAKELRQRGFSSFDADEVAGLARWEDQDGLAIERPRHPSRHWLDRNFWNWDEQRLKELLASSPPPVFVCGSASNQIELIKHFDLVIVLELRREVPSAQGRACSDRVGEHVHLPLETAGHRDTERGLGDEVTEALRAHDLLSSSTRSEPWAGSTIVRQCFRKAVEQPLDAVTGAWNCSISPRGQRASIRIEASKAVRSPSLDARRFLQRSHFAFSGGRFAIDGMRDDAKDKSTSEIEVLMTNMVGIFESGDLAQVNAIIASEYRDHQGLAGVDVQGRDGFSAVVTAARAAWSDLRVEVADLIAEGDKVVARVRWHGTNKDDVVIDRETIDIVRFDNGLAVEH